MNTKTLRLFGLVLLIPTIAGCVKIPAKTKPPEATKVILVDTSFADQKLFWVV